MNYILDYILGLLLIILEMVMELFLCKRMSHIYVYIQGQTIIWCFEAL